MFSVDIKICKQWKYSYWTLPHDVHEQGGLPQNDPQVRGEDAHSHKREYGLAPSDGGHNHSVYCRHSAQHCHQEMGVQ